MRKNYIQLNLKFLVFCLIIIIYSKLLLWIFVLNRIKLTTFSYFEECKYKYKSRNYHKFIEKNKFIIYIIHLYLFIFFSSALYNFKLINSKTLIS